MPITRDKFSSWFPGTEREWRDLPLKQREGIAFAETGCAVAYATWESPVDCVHTQCRIMRGEIPAICLTNAVLHCEAESGWLRFTKKEDRPKVARIFKAYRKAARETGIYDPWKIGWQLMVYGGVNL